MEKKLKIALFNIYSEPYGDRRTGGLITAAIYLSQYGYTPVAFGKPKKSHMSGWTYIKSFDELNDYDFIIFSSAGSNTDVKTKKQNKTPWWMSELPKVKKPFAVQCHNEIDEAIMPFREIFFSNKLFRLFLPICANIFKKMPDVDTHVHLAHQNIIKMKKFNKQNLVISTCRATSTKRVIEFVSKAKKFKEIGYNVEVWGPESSYFYMKALKETNPGYWEHKGMFPDFAALDSVMGRAKYHWNCRSFRKKHKVSPRFEIATIEALERGCIPIVEKDSTPIEYFDYVITHDTKINNDELIDKVKNNFGSAEKCIEIFNNKHRDKELRLKEIINKYV